MRPRSLGTMGSLATAAWSGRGRASGASLTGVMVTEPGYTSEPVQKHINIISYVCMLIEGANFSIE